MPRGRRYVEELLRVLEESVTAPTGEVAEARPRPDLAITIPITKPMTAPISAPIICPRISFDVE
jgi:hypothetical protein